MPQPKVRPQALFGEEEARIALIRRKLTITKLAARIKRPRESVSRAIHQGVFPKLRVLIADQLHLS